MQTVKKKKKNNYIDNEKLYTEFVKYRAAYDDAKLRKLPRPPVPDTIGHAIYLIANGLARGPTYFHLPFKEDMIADAMEVCIRYCHNFDPEKTKNPFGYITMIVSKAFWQRGKKERKQEDIKGMVRDMYDIQNPKPSKRVNTNWKLD